MLVSVFTAGVGSSEHAFAVYSDLTPEKLVRVHEEVFYEEALNRPILLHEGVSDTVRKAYVSFDRYPYFPFRAYRYMRSTGLWESEKYFPRVFRAMAEDLMGYGPFLSFVSTKPKAPPSPTVPFLVDPESLDVMYFSAYVHERNLREEVKDRVRDVVFSLLENYARLLKHIRVVGWVPKALLREPFVLLNIAFLHLYLGQLEFLPRSRDLRRELYAVMLARAMSKRGLHRSKEVSDWVYANVILHSLPFFYVSPRVAYPYARPDVDYSLAVAAEIGFLSAFRAEFMYLKSPVYRLAEFLHRSGLGLPDVITASRDPRVVEYVNPSETFSFVPLLYRFTGDVTVKEVKQYAGTWVLSEKEVTRTPHDVFLKHYSTAVLVQSTPKSYSNREFSELRDSLTSYPENYPEKSFLRKHFLEKNFLLKRGVPLMSLLGPSIRTSVINH